MIVLKYSLVSLLLFLLIQVAYVKSQKFTDLSGGSISCSQLVPALLLCPFNATDGAIIDAYMEVDEPYLSSLSVRFRHNLTYVTGAYLGLGFAGSNGPRLYEFSRFTSRSSQGNHETFTLINQTIIVSTSLNAPPRTRLITVADQQRAILLGQFFLQITTYAYPTGLLRGQLTFRPSTYANTPAPLIPVIFKDVPVPYVAPSIAPLQAPVDIDTEITPNTPVTPNTYYQ